MKNRAQLIKKITLLEKQMLSKLEEIRETFEHKGIKGTIVEKQFRTFLRSYLPRRLDVGEGEIIDRNFNTSNQMDVVITDENHPFSYDEQNLGLFFIEGVSASGEIKSVLTSSELNKSLNNAYNYKKLKMIPPSGSIMRTNKEDHDRFYITPPFFIFAFESQIRLERILEIVKNYKKNEYRPGFTTDGIFIMGKGFVVDLGNGGGTFKIINKDRKCMVGWTGRTSTNILFDFLSWLTCVMPRIQGGSNILIPYLLDKIKK